jgi:hypothetical protein
MKKLWLTAVFSALILALTGAENGILFQYDFSKDGKLDLQRKAKIADGVLKFDGKGDFAYVPDSSGMHYAKKGMTLAATVKLNYSPSTKDFNDKLDMFFSKGREFIFGKSGDKLYFNFHDGKTWCATTFTAAGAVPGPGKWAHVAAVVEYVNDAAQGDVGYRISIYLNGEKEITKKFLFVEPAQNKDRIELGKGFGGGPWFMNGEFANAVMFDHALNAAQIAELCSREPRVKMTRKGFTEIAPELKKTLDGLKHTGKTPVRWLAASLERAAVSGYDQQALHGLAATAAKFRNDDLAEFTGQFNRAQKNCRILLTADLAAAVLTGHGSGTHPVIGLLDRRSGRDVFGVKSIAWEIHWAKGKQTGTLENLTAGVTWNSTVKDNIVTITWTGKTTPAFAAESEVKFIGPRMESTFSVRNDSDHRIDTVRYPVWMLNHLGKGDTLVHPYMSGILVPNPTSEQFRHGQKAIFPSGRTSMQFGAYFNAAKDGVYFAQEDPLARSKTYSVEGKYNNVCVSWEHPVIADRDKNHYRQNGKAVLSVYRGQWYEAGQIYRKFLEKEAAWWIPDLPRKSTPEWFRNNTLWVLFFTRDEKLAEEILNTCTYLRSYFELPFAVHWYSWSDDAKQGWPHYPIKDFTLKYNRAFHEAGIYTVPYIDSRLWKLKDGPNRTDYQFSSHGRKYAAKDPAGKFFIEDYGKGNVYAVMCPYAKGWQDVLVKLVQRVSSYGFNGVYHDQVGTGGPRLCYDRSHGHPLNDSSVWLEKGYWPLFDRFFAYLHKNHPGFCHTTEENAEPYLKQMDGYLVWRWTDNGQIPLYQSIYSGRAQFVGRLYNHSHPGERQSFFSKLAQQLVNAEQLGWFMLSDVREADNRRLFTKKAMHVRHALLYWFNCGRMLAPIDFGSTMKMEQPKWGGNVPQHVRMPVIANSAWEGPDGSRMRLFVNTQSSESSAVPVIESAKGFWICREGAEAPVFSAKAPSVTLKGLNFEVWIEGSKERAEAIQKTLRKIASFDVGKPIRLAIKFAGKKTVGIPDKFYTPADSAGNLYCNATTDNHHFGWIQDGAMISYGTIDFGKTGARSITVKVAVDPGYAGGSIQMLTTRTGQPETVSAEIQLKSTGGWNEYREIRMPLKAPLTGPHQVVFRIGGNAACNFAAWKYQAE